MPRRRRGVAKASSTRCVVGVRSSYRRELLAPFVRVPPGAATVRDADGLSGQTSALPPPERRKHTQSVSSINRPLTQVRPPSEINRAVHVKTAADGRAPLVLSSWRPTYLYSPSRVESCGLCRTVGSRAVPSCAVSSRSRACVSECVESVSSAKWFGASTRRFIGHSCLP